MKLGFSTLGCPDWTWKDIVSSAKDLEFDGIEIRGVENEIYVPDIPEFKEDSYKETIGYLRRIDLEIPCLTSSVYLFMSLQKEQYLKEGKTYIDTASKVGTPYVRVLGDRNPEPSDEVDYACVVDGLKELGNYAAGKNVRILVETNGVFSDSAKMLKLLQDVNLDSVGVLWDIHHPFRYMNEKPEFTYDKLKKFIYHVHIKDSKFVDGKVKYCMLGQGDVPLKQVLELLKRNDYKGYLSLEWVKRWNLELEEPGIVFSHFTSYMRRLLDSI